MADIIYERHSMSNPHLPFIFHTDFCYKRAGAIANWHDNTEFLYCIEGEGNVNIDGTDTPMAKGDIVIINAGCLHSVSTAEFVKYHCLIIDNIFFTDNGIDIGSISFEEKICDSKVKHFFEKTVEMLSKKQEFFSVAETRLCILEFLCYICRQYSKPKIKKSNQITKGYEAILDAVEYINNHFAEKLTLDDISTRAGFSRYHFSRIFKQNTGATVIDHINARRCDNARVLLRETQKTISEICSDCGFETPSYFAKTFSKLYGILPSEYRKLHSKL